MPDDPIQADQPVQDIPPEIKPDLSAEASAKEEEVKPVEDNPQPEEKKEPEQPKEEVPVETPKVEEPKPEEKPGEPQSPQSPESPLPAEASAKVGEPEIKIVEKEIIKEVPVEVIKEVKVVDEEEVKKQVDDRLKEKLLENKKKADETRLQRRKDNLNRIIELAKKKEINNQDVRNLLQVFQSTATDYLTELSKSGRLKSEKKARATVYKS
ncbi:MAG: hypothetical protein Q8P26_01780 [Candidatus Levybacteria bacterium]|nr:hypothetical protein [Candidatus Levybacteria bacterium]